MILRYSVETKHRPAFTAKKRVESEEHAGRQVMALKQRNKKEGHTKYSSFTLYDDQNNCIGKYH